ncbi:hypothetical protein BV898_10483 [Hypsibius exemplaris]|uniref:Uncharacterized protein n=1 Tax=Hypsibius exemplaris TaxID=2072580 RepID=A0A1W0WJN8_HYPEX|nr:hypothetical protein BV898_10483 [Hypsibius exemplaris]
MLNDLIVLLKPFETTTEELSASRTPTLHLVVNVFKAVCKHLEEYQSEYPSLIKVAELLLVNFKFIVQPEHTIACFLHSPFRRLEEDRNSLNPFAAVRSRLKNLAVVWFVD